MLELVHFLIKLVNVAHVKVRVLIFSSWLQKGQGPPSREPVFSEEQRKQMMAYAYRKQEDLKVSFHIHEHLISFYVFTKS